MTQPEIELIARDLRTKCMRSSWNDLVVFWQGVMGNLESAYHALEHSAAMGHTPTGNVADGQRVARDKLALTLSQLGGEHMAAKLDAEAAGRTES